MQETQLHLIRHGETAWNVEQRFQGHTDISLNDTGLAQAKKLGQFMSGTRLDVLYASDLSRAVQTAEQIAPHHGLQVRKSAGLRERSFGEWEGLTIEQMSEQHVDHLEVRRKGGLYGVELSEGFQQRLVETLTELARQHLGQSIAVVSHGGSINNFLHWVTDGRLGTGVTKIDNTSVTRVKFFETGEWEVIDVNETGHL